MRIGPGLFRRFCAHTARGNGPGRGGDRGADRWSAGGIGGDGAGRSETRFRKYILKSSCKKGAVSSYETRPLFISGEHSLMHFIHRIPAPPSVRPCRYIPQQQDHGRSAAEDKHGKHGNFTASLPLPCSGQVLFPARRILLFLPPERIQNSLPLLLHRC